MLSGSKTVSTQKFQAPFFFINKLVKASLAGAARAWSYVTSCALLCSNFNASESNENWPWCRCQYVLKQSIWLIIGRVNYCSFTTFQDIIIPLPITWLNFLTLAGFPCIIFPCGVDTKVLTSPYFLSTNEESASLGTCLIVYFCHLFKEKQCTEIQFLTDIKRIITLPKSITTYSHIHLEYMIYLLGSEDNVDDEGDN